MNFAIFSDGFSSVLKRVNNIPIFSCFVKEILLFSLYKKAEKFLEQNFGGEQKSNFSSKFLLNSHDILRLKFLKV